MEYYNNTTLCISYDNMVPDIVTKSNYDNLSQRKQLTVLRRGCYGTPALIDYESLPERIKTAIKLKYGPNLEKVAMANPIKKAIVPDVKAVEFFKTHRLPGGELLKPEKQKQYADTAAVLNAIIHVVNDRTGFKKTCGGNASGVWEGLKAALLAIRSEYKYALPGSVRRLRQKVEDYKKEGFISLVSGKIGNSNADKVQEDEQQATMRKLLRDHRNLDNAQIASLYNMVAEKLNWKRVTPATIGNRRIDWDVVTYSGRRGETSFNNVVAMQVKRRAPQFPMLYWTMDGWDVELLYQKTTTTITDEGKTKTVTTYHHRLTVVVVLDPCNKYPVGFAIGTHENPALIKEALRNAINHTAECFGMHHKPKQLQTDRYGNGALKDFYESVTAKYTPARVKNSKSKVIEPYFKRLNKKYCQLLPNWAGFGVTADKNSQPNDEYLNKIRHSFPDEAECIKQIKRIIFAERKEKYELYKQLWSDLPNEHKLPVSEVDYLLSMGETTGFTNRLSAPGLIVTINGIKRTYDSFDSNFRKLSHEDWTVRYNLENLQKIVVVNSTGTQQFLLSEKYEQPMALAERVENDAIELKRVNDFNKALKSEVMQSIESDAQKVEQLFIHNPQLDDTLSKFVLVDSMGQHKDRKSANRLQHNAQKLLKKQNDKLELQEQKTFAAEQLEYLESKTDFSKYLNA
ncbi:hypothetical protein [Pinibacter soli]|uniref:Integrase catalytic domain-containing protein n=1 Tax=Pinibacter soli TaxID=3044211 RepID=A0ABT6R9C0_9BACT|nr:hypothetical protein [Pinibacter soli]MDI3319160.1 hypothetical protein [Pinibacter soli]